MCSLLFFFFFKQKTAYDMRISDWSSDVCSSDLISDPSRLTTSNRFRRMPQLPPSYSLEPWPRQSAAMSWVIDRDPASRRPAQVARPSELRTADGRGVQRQLDDPRAVSCPRAGERKIGRAACRERGSQSVAVGVGAGK